MAPPGMQRAKLIMKLARKKDLEPTAVEQFVVMPASGCSDEVLFLDDESKNDAIPSSSRLLFIGNSIETPPSTSSTELTTLQNVKPFSSNVCDSLFTGNDNEANRIVVAESPIQIIDNFEGDVAIIGTPALEILPTHKDKDQQNSDNESLHDFSDDSQEDPNYSESSSSNHSSSSDSSSSEPVESNVGNDHQNVEEPEKSYDVPNKGPQSVEEKKGRKRKAKPHQWKKAVNKMCRNLGKEYTYLTAAKEKKIVTAKVIGPPCTDKCLLRCTTKITEDQRKVIFADYWALGDLQRQRDFLLICMETIQPKYRYLREGSHRKNNNSFHFNINDKKIRVCKTFFKSTLAVSDRPLRTVVEKNKVATMGMIDVEKRGKHGNHHQLDPNIKEAVRSHINSIPKIESHYCRKDSKREYIEGSKTLADLHRDYCKMYKEPHANYVMYSRIFNGEFNITFHKPKKDQCEDCIMFINAPAEEKKQLQGKYDRHLLEKDLARKEKEADKNKDGNTTVVAVYDLQAVLQCPKGVASSFYYVSKVNVFNFTVYELKAEKPKAFCFVWDETEANRGANEIGTCVLKYIESLESRIKNSEMFDVIFYSDNCCGQQKNRFMISMYLFAVSKYPFINSITHKFLIKGHSQNEGDSVHSVIEGATKKVLKSGSIFVPEQYFTLIRGAKKTGEPYKVIEMSHESFLDLKDLAARSSLPLSLKNSENGDAVKISTIAVLQFKKNHPREIFYKTSYLQESFNIIELKGGRTARKSASPDLSGIQLKELYTSKIKLVAKKPGLLNLLKKNIIPKCYSYFYENL